MAADAEAASGNGKGRDDRGMRMTPSSHTVRGGETGRCLARQDVWIIVASRRCGADEECFSSAWPSAAAGARRKRSHGPTSACTANRQTTNVNASPRAVARKSLMHAPHGTRKYSRGRLLPKERSKYTNPGPRKDAGPLSPDCSELKTVICPAPGGVRPPAVFACLLKA
jgi:hypothetical protein